MITKTAYLSYLHCPKRFWLERMEPERAEQPSEVARRRMREGTKAGKFARSWHPFGWLVPFKSEAEEMAQATAEALAEGEATLFEAAFLAGDLYVKADILQQKEEGLHLIEVKATNSLKKEHLPDIAFQQYVMQQAGYDAARASLMHLNRECQAPDLDDLFITEEVTLDTEVLLPQVAKEAAEMRQIAGLDEEPAVDIGRYCFKPDKCPFYDYCWQGIEGLTIFNIPRLNAVKEQKLRDMGVLYLADVPADSPLTAKQREYVDFHMQKKVGIDNAAIQKELAGLEYPLYFFDFETISYAVPRFDGTTPYQQVPFQYSIHVLQKDGTMTHHEYLHTQTDDPRPALLDTLLADIGPTGHIIVYNAPFERGILKGLASSYPQYVPQLQGMIDRLWDQLVIFRKYYKHYAFGGSNSLKSVLPVIVPDLSYENMAVADGLMAQVAWEKMIAMPPGREKEQQTADLLAYCHLDTLAMVEMHDVLAQLE